MQYCTFPPSPLVSGAGVSTYNTAYKNTSFFNCTYGYNMGADGEPLYLCGLGTATNGNWVYLNGSCSSMLHGFFAINQFIDC